MEKIDTMSENNQEKREKCYIQARSFFFAAKRCGKIEECEESGSLQCLPIPEYMNIAFSCELYFKTLLYRDKEIIKEHKLSILFSKLDINLRHRVASILLKHEDEIEKQLKEHLNLFTEMRYRFESTQYSESFSIPLNFFYSLAKSLDELAKETIGVVPYPSKDSMNVDIAYVKS